MGWIFLLPIYLGLATVLQGGLNRQITQHWGLATAVFLNNLVFLAAGLSLFLMVRAAPSSLPMIFRDKGSLSSFSWWYLLPGLLGFSLVAGIPLAISKLGSLKVFVGLVGAQMVGSLLWDALVENIPISGYRVTGIVFAFLGALLVNR